MNETEHIVEWVEYSPEEIEAMTEIQSRNYLRDLKRYMAYAEDIRRLINVSRALFLYHRYGYNDAEISEVTKITIATVNSLRKRHNLNSNYIPSSQKGIRREDHND